MHERRWWFLQAVTGLALVFLLGLHWVAQHYIAEGGLRTYQQVVAYVRHPLIWPLEALFLLVVSVHAALGLRAILLDLGLTEARLRRTQMVLVLLTLLAVAYGWWLLARLLLG